MGATAGAEAAGAGTAALDGAGATAGVPAVEFELCLPAMPAAAESGAGAEALRAAGDGAAADGVPTAGAEAPGAGTGTAAATPGAGTATAGAGAGTATDGAGAGTATAGAGAETPAPPGLILNVHAVCDTCIMACRCLICKSELMSVLEGLNNSAVCHRMLRRRQLKGM